MTSRAIAAAAFGAFFSFGMTSTQSAPPPYNAPEETSVLAPGPNADLAQVYCGACHSYEYILTQPRGQGFGRDFWQAEVTKMIKVYGAPIDESDVGKIVDYLAATY